MSDDKHPVKIDDDAYAIAQKWADKRGVGIGETVSALLKTADSRLEALNRYAANTATTKEKPKKAAKKAPTKKKAATKKTSAEQKAAA